MDYGGKNGAGGHMETGNAGTAATASGTAAKADDAEGKARQAGPKSGPSDGNGRGGVDLRVSAGPLCATVLLGLCELIFLGAVANYLSMHNAGIALFFISQGILMVAMSVAALAWGVVKNGGVEASAILECAKAGATLGICAAIAVCALAGIFAFAGMGPDRLAQNYPGTGIWQAAITYVGIFAEILLLYAVAGAAAGAAAKLFLSFGMRKIGEAAAYINSGPESGEAN